MTIPTVEQLTGRKAGMRRIRLYFLVITVRHMVLGLVLYRGQATLTESPAMQYMVEVAPIWWWSVVMVIVGFVCLGGVIAPREQPMRWVVVVSIVLDCIVSVLLLLAVVTDPEVTGVIALLSLSLVAKDYLIVGYKWTDPFENIVPPRAAEVLREHQLEAT